MADIETSVAITAQTGDLQSGMEQAAVAVARATAAMGAQFSDLGIAAQTAQEQIGVATEQIGSTLGSLQARAANLAGSVKDAMGRVAGSIDASAQFPGISVTEQPSGAGTDGTSKLKDSLDLEWGLEQDYYDKKLAAAISDAQIQQKLTEQQQIAYEKYLA